LFAFYNATHKGVLECNQDAAIIRKNLKDAQGSHKKVRATGRKPEARKEAKSNE
jgi:hypothetical protein